jgi:integrase
VACFVFWREICHPTFSDFCNKICHERCGLRAGEVVRLKVKHIDSAQKITRVEQSKGRKDRNVMLRPRRSTCCGNGGGCVRRVTIRENRRKERWLFPSRKTPGRPMTTRQLGRLFHEATEAAGIKKSVTLHGAGLEKMGGSLSHPRAPRRLPPHPLLWPARPWQTR